jgi:hypothetical protein
MAARAADAPDFGAVRVFTEIGYARAGGNFVDGAERDEVHDSEEAIGSGNVSVEMEVGAEEGGAVFAEKNDEREHGEEREEEIDAEVFGVGHE